MSREHLINVYRKTQTDSLCYGGRPSQSKIYKVSPDISEYYPDTNPTVEVVQEDTLQCASRYNNPLILNMASEYSPGGGAHNGSSAQEEQLFYRSNYMSCTSKALYPIPYGGYILTRGVTVFKDINYNRIAPQKYDFIAMPALRRPETNGDFSYCRDEDHEDMTCRINAIFECGIVEGKRDLILGALGCGAFKIPPYAVANIFRKAIETYGNYFDNIVFAVLGEYNFRIFNEVLSKCD